MRTCQPTIAQTPYKGVAQQKIKGGRIGYVAFVMSVAGKRVSIDGGPFPTAAEAALARARYKAAVGTDQLHEGRLPQPEHGPDISDEQAKQIAASEGLVLRTLGRNGRMGHSRTVERASGYAYVVRTRNGRRFKAMQPGDPKHSVLGTFGSAAHAALVVARWVVQNHYDLDAKIVRPRTACGRCKVFGGSEVEARECRGGPCAGDRATKAGNRSRACDFWTCEGERKEMSLSALKARHASEERERMEPMRKRRREAGLGE